MVDKKMARPEILPEIYKKALAKWRADHKLQSHISDPKVLENILIEYIESK
jgi:hypothetical protein